MAATSQTKIWTTHVTTTIDQWVNDGNLFDQITFDDPFLAIWAGRTLPEFMDNMDDSEIPPLGEMEGNGIKEMEGGNNIQIGIRTARNNTVKWIAPYGTLDTTTAEPATIALFTWKTIAGTVSVSKIHIGRNSGKAQMWNYVETLMDDLTESITNRFATDLYQDGTGDGSQALTGLQALVSEGPTVGTVGGINRANEVFWRNLATNHANAAFDIGNIRTMFNNVSSGKDHADLIVTDQTTFESWEDDMSPQQQQVQNKSMANLDFLHLVYKNTTPLVFSEFCPAGSAYFLNKKHLKLVLNTNFQFAMDEDDWVTTPEQKQVIVNAAMMDAELVTVRPNKLGVVFNIGAGT